MDDIAVVPTLVILCVCECPPPRLFLRLPCLIPCPPPPTPNPFVCIMAYGRCTINNSSSSSSSLSYIRAQAHPSFNTQQANIVLHPHRTSYWGGGGVQRRHLCNASLQCVLKGVYFCIHLTGVCLWRECVRVCARVRSIVYAINL